MIGIVGYEFFIEQKEAAQIVEQGSLPKKETNLYLLPQTTTDQVIHHNYYSLSYSEEHEQAEWVAYELKKDHLSNLDRSRPYFKIDRAVKTGAAHWRNYKNSGYDRGHLCPAGDRRFSLEAYNETFLTSNISPQEHNFNSGIWNRLEQKGRYWAKKFDGVYVVTGGVLNDDLPNIGSEGVSVPGQFYRIFVDLTPRDPKMIAFLIPHHESNKPLDDFVVTVDSLEILTGIDFFPLLEDELENRLERSHHYQSWNR